MAPGRTPRRHWCRLKTRSIQGSAQRVADETLPSTVGPHRLSAPIVTPGRPSRTAAVSSDVTVPTGTAIDIRCGIPASGGAFGAGIAAPGRTGLWSAVHCLISPCVTKAGAAPTRGESGRRRVGTGGTRFQRREPRCRSTRRAPRAPVQQEHLQVGVGTDPLGPHPERVQALVCGPFAGIRCIGKACLASALILPPPSYSGSRFVVMSSCAASILRPGQLL